MNKRVYWIDTAKCFGMFFIYVGHFAAAAGRAYPWVFSFHVALFFFLSGCVERYNRRSIPENLLHKCLTVLVPFYFFGVLTVIYYAVETRSLVQVPELLLQLVMGGIRNHVAPGAGIWFLTCLFTVSVIFSLIRLLKREWLMLFATVGLFLAAQFLIEPKPISSPHLFFNLDSACYYLLYYCLGFLAYPRINRLLEAKDTRSSILKISVFLLCMLYSAALFFGADPLPKPSADRAVLPALCEVPRALFSIVVVIGVSELTGRLRILRKIGERSLYLCGNEYLIKSIVPAVCACFGLTVMPDSAIQVFLYTPVLMLLAAFLLAPAEGILLERVRRIGKKSLQDKGQCE